MRKNSPKTREQNWFAGVDGGASKTLAPESLLPSIHSDEAIDLGTRARNLGLRNGFRVLVFFV